MGFLYHLCQCRRPQVPKASVGASRERNERDTDASSERTLQSGWLLVLNIFNTLISYCVLDSAGSLGCNVDQSSKAPQGSVTLLPRIATEFFWFCFVGFLFVWWVFCFVSLVFCFGGS